MNQVTKILHLTDLHLFGDPQTKLIGINPLQTLQQVVGKITADTDNGSADLLVLTGDVSQDFSLASYEIAAKILEDIKCPMAATMGNHDHLSAFTQIFSTPTKIVDINSSNWRVLILNSHWPNHVNGNLTDTELTFLQENLDKSADRPIIIFLHHHILSVNSNWLDKLNLYHDSQFLKIIDQYKNIKAVVCGHIHQDTTILRKNVVFLSTPSTSWQFTLGSNDFKLDNLMPGYRWINLYEDGTIQTEVIRIPQNEAFVPDMNSKGY